jgi:hypothetical protein
MRKRLASRSPGAQDEAEGGLAGVRRSELVSAASGDLGGKDSSKPEPVGLGLASGCNFESGSLIEDRAMDMHYPTVPDRSYFH